MQRPCWRGQEHCSFLPWFGCLRVRQLWIPRKSAYFTASPKPPSNGQHDTSLFVHLHHHKLSPSPKPPPLLTALPYSEGPPSHSPFPSFMAGLPAPSLRPSTPIPYSYVWSRRSTQLTYTLASSTGDKLIPSRPPTPAQEPASLPAHTPIQDHASMSDPPSNSCSGAC